MANDIEAALDRLEALYDEADQSWRWVVRDPLTLAVMLFRAFERSLQVWGGLGLWEYRERNTATELDATYWVTKADPPSLHFEFALTASVVPWGVLPW